MAFLIHSTLYFLRHLPSRLKQWVADRTYLKVRAHCATEFHGSPEYGSWCVCPDNLGPTTVVYSFGVGENIEFDLSLIRKYGLMVHAFDPTPRSIEWVKARELPPQFVFHPYGLAGYDGVARFFPPENPEHISHTLLERRDASGPPIELPVRRLETIVRELGHSKIDMLKMDIEGAEYGVIEDLARSQIEISQILIEFHDRFEGVGPSKTRRAMRILFRLGFRVFDVSPNRQEASLIQATKPRENRVAS